MFQKRFDVLAIGKWQIT